MCKGKVNKAVLLKKYCTGCGLCHALQGVTLTEKEKGFLTPKLDSKAAIEFCEKLYSGIAKEIHYKLSFFCVGMPSKTACVFLSVRYDTVRHVMQGRS